MTLLSGVLGARNASIEDPTVPLTGGRLSDWVSGGKVASGVRVNERTALGMPAVWRAVNLIAATSASLPLKPYQRGATTRAALEDGPAVNLLAKPHPDMSPFEFWETLYAHALLWGNAYCRILRNRLGQPTELWPIHPGRVVPGRTSETGTKVYLVDGTDAFTDREILHIPAFGYDGISGLSPIRVARQAIGLGLAAEEFGARLFSDGALSAGVLSTDAQLTPEQADQVKARWKATRTGIDKTHDPIVLGSGLAFQPLSIPPGDAQFIESRRFQISEIARMFGIPPHMLADTEKSTSWGTGIEQQSIGFVVYTLRPWLTRFEQRVTQVLDPENVYARYSVEGLLRGDSAQRAAYQKSLWEIGVLSTNDIRALEERDDVEGGDVRYRPLNMGLLGEVDESTTTPTEEVPADAAAQ